MELVYLWVEEYKNIYRQGFNFSPKFECKYDAEKKELSIDKNHDYMENFFGDNINVTAIVGKNGSGKSSVLECIKLGVDSFIENDDIQFGANHPNFHKYILLYKYGDKFYDLGNTKFNDDYIIKGRENFKIVEKLLLKNYHSIPEVDINITKSILDTFHSIDSNLITFFYPDTIILNFLEYIQQDIHIDKLSFNDKLEFIVGSIFNEIKEKLKERIKNNKTTILDYITEIESSDLIQWNVFSTEVQTLKNLSIIDNFINKNIQAQLVNGEGAFYQLNSQEALNDENKKFLLALDELNILEIYDSRKKEVNIDHYKSFGISFSSLSSGEKTLLKIVLLILQDIQKSESENLNRLSIFLDEPENKLHPHWQKNLFNEIINIFRTTNICIDLFISSHSPFLLSDIPKENIIFLDKDENGNCKVVDGLKEKKQTFGANIHTLLSDGFFMEDGLMGEFAKAKIDRTIKLLNQDHLSKEELRYCEQIISIIGEPIVKNQLQRMLDSKKISYIAKDTREEIEFLKHRIDLLSKRL